MSEKTKELMKKERLKANFDVRALTNLWEGGADMTELREKMEAFVAGIPEFSKEDWYYLSRSELYQRILQKQRRLVEVMMENGFDDRERVLLVELIDEWLPISLHAGMFIPTIEGQGTEEQKHKWLPLAYSLQIIGTYAQTELGHGSYLQGIETTATYDVAHGQFVINTPTITATKFWPGGLGKMATHCTLMARLIVEGKDFGPHQFIVPLRSLDDHTVLPGVSVGDIGPKFGFETVDNGYLQLNHVRVPLDHMLMRFAQLAPNGAYTKPLHAKLSYGTMVQVRAQMLTMASRMLARAVTIAVRYAAVRQQGMLPNSSLVGEMAILDYKVHQARLLPLMASAHAIRYTAFFIASIHTRQKRQLAQQDFSLVAEVHAACAGLKSFCTWEAANGIEECRRCCGGAGYLKSSGLPTLYATYVSACTYEGDNVVLLQQTVRFLFKQCAVGLASQPLEGSTISFLSDIHTYQNQHCMAKFPADLLQEDCLLSILGHVAVRLAHELYTRFQALQESGISYGEAWNMLTPRMLPVARAYTFYLLVSNFFKASRSIQGSRVEHIVVLLAQLFATKHLMDTSTELLEDGFCTPHHISWLKENFESLLEKIRPQAVPLTDAFNLSDRLLNSTIGRADGDVYTAIMESTRREPLNKSEIVPGYTEYIQPLITRFQSRM